MCNINMIHSIIIQYVGITRLSIRNGHTISPSFCARLCEPRITRPLQQKFNMIGRKLHAVKR